MKLGLSKASIAALKSWDTRRKRKKRQAKKPEVSFKKPLITKWYPDKWMSQIYNQGLEFAFVSSAGEQCCAFAYCKDFLQDAIFGAVNNKSSAIHGFSYDPAKDPPLDLEKTRLAVRLKDASALGVKCKKALHFLNKIEAELGFKPSKLAFGGKYENGQDKVYVFIGDPRWMLSSPLISLYSLCVRKGMTYRKGDAWRRHFDEGESIGRNDKTYCRNAKKALDLLLAKKVEKVFGSEIKDNYPPEGGASWIHNAGIVSFSSGRIPDRVNKNWKIKKA